MWYTTLKEKVNSVFDKITMRLFNKKFGDNIKHPVLSGLINIFLFIVIQFFLDKETSLMISSATTIIIGLLVEKLDARKTYSSKRDIFNNMIGIVLSSLLIIII